MPKSDTRPKYYLDACVFLALINKEPGEPVVTAILEEATNNKIAIYTSMLSITEVSYTKIEKDQAALSDEDELKLSKLWEPPSPVQLVDSHELIIHMARDIMRQCIEKQLRVVKP